MSDEPKHCTGGRHNAPATGGSCPCGMVTCIPAPARRGSGPTPELLSLVAACLGDGVLDPEHASADLLRERTERLIAALSTAGLELTPGTADRLAA